MEFLLFVGAKNSLADQEVLTRIPNAKLVFPHIYSFNSISQIKAKQTVASLGSSLKLAVKTKEKPTAVALAQLITTKTFSLTFLNNKQAAKPLSLEIKNKLNKPARYLLSSNYFGLSPVLNTKRNLTELFINTLADSVYQTIWTHDFKLWIKKDRQLPFADAHAGLLPPKIARSLINLLPLKLNSTTKILDPFCGSGRIVVEACQLGLKVLGSDINQKAIDQTKANLKALNLQADIFLADATHLSQKLKTPVDAIVTENYLGKPSLRPDKIKYTINGLKKLYKGALKEFSKILKPGGYLVIIFPLYEYKKVKYSTSQIIDDLSSLGYNVHTRGLIYSRPQAQVKREIVIIKKT